MSRLLFALFQGGGNLALILPIVSCAARRGHSVRVLAGPGIWPSRRPVSIDLRERVNAAGAQYVPFCEPEVHPFDAHPKGQGLVLGWTLEKLARATAYVEAYRWAPCWADNVAAELRRDSADLVIADFLLPGALVAAEAAEVSAASLVHGIYKHRPAPGLPPVGFGFSPARGPIGSMRDLFCATVVAREYRRRALPHLNHARGCHGLTGLGSVDEQFDRIARVLILTSQTFDFRARALPQNVRYVGTPADLVAPQAWPSPWCEADRRPVVLVSLSTLQQGQGPLLERILSAVAGMPVRVLVTLGPSLERAGFTASANVVFAQYVPHAAVLPRVSAMVSQCGIGSVMKALRHGVPLVCLPLVGDQSDNAARVVARGAGIRLHATASPAQIRRALERVLIEPVFRDNARAFATRLGGEADAAESTVRELEAIIAT